MVTAIMTIGEKLKELRKNNNFTLEDIGKMVDVHMSVISKYEKGVTEISIDKLLMFCHIFNVSPNHFLSWPEINTYTGKVETEDNMLYFENYICEWHNQIRYDLKRTPYDMSLLCVNAVLEKVEEVYSQKKLTDKQ